MRIGIVDYVNSWPLAWGLLGPGGRAGVARSGRQDGVEAVFLPPAEIAERLAAGALDVGMLPAIELARIPGVAAVPGLAIAATHEVRSVLLVSRVPLPEIRRVALDENSRTSAALVRLLLAERYGLRPEYLASRPDLETMFDRQDADAALLIGDPALRVDRRDHVVLDLAGEWFEWTRLPFVFAVWAVRPGFAAPGLVERLLASHRHGWESLDAIVAEAARESGLAPVVLRDYYTRNLRYEMGPAEQAGLQEFLRRAATAGLVPEAGPLRFLASTAAAR